jgi:hypothetical protein
VSSYKTLLVGSIVVLAVGLGVSATAMAAAPPWIPINQSRNATTDNLTVTFNDSLPSGTGTCSLVKISANDLHQQANQVTANSCTFNLSEGDLDQLQGIVRVEFYEGPTIQNDALIGTSDEFVLMAAAPSQVITEMITNLAVTTAKIADGAVTQDKLADDVAMTTTAKTRAYLGTSQLNLPHGSFVKVAFASESYDPGTNFDTTTNRFVAPVSGYYEIDAMLRWNQTPARTRYEVAIYKNGSNAAASILTTSINGSVTSDVSDTLYLNQNDSIEIYARSLAGNNKADIVAGENSTSMTIHLLSQ